MLLSVFKRSIKVFVGLCLSIALITGIVYYGLFFLEWIASTFDKHVAGWVLGVILVFWLSFVISFVLEKTEI